MRNGVVLAKLDALETTLGELRSLGTVTVVGLDGGARSRLDIHIWPKAWRPMVMCERWMATGRGLGDA